MKKTLILVLAGLLLTLVLSAATLGVYVKNWKGCVDNEWLYGARVTRVEECYPAYCHLFANDVITEAVLIPYGSVWCYPQAPVSGTLVNLNPECTLQSQLGLISPYSPYYSYKQIKKWADLESLLKCASPNSILLMRVYGAGTSGCCCDCGSWRFVSVSLNTAGAYVLWSYPCCQPCAPCQPVVAPCPTCPTYYPTTYVVPSGVPTVVYPSSSFQICIQVY